MKEQGLNDCTINKFLLNYIEPLNLEGKDEQSSKTQIEEKQAMEAAEPKLLMTSDESNGNQAAHLEGDLHCDPLSKCDSKIHSPKSPSSLHDGSKQDDCVKQESPVLSNEEYSYQEFVLVQEELDWSPEEENTREKSLVRLHVNLTLPHNSVSRTDELIVCLCPFISVFYLFIYLFSPPFQWDPRWIPWTILKTS